VNANDLAQFLQGWRKPATSHAPFFFGLLFFFDSAGQPVRNGLFGYAKHLGDLKLALITQRIQPLGTGLAIVVAQRKATILQLARQPERFQLAADRIAVDRDLRVGAISAGLVRQHPVPAIKKDAIGVDRDQLSCRLDLIHVAHIGLHGGRIVAVYAGVKAFIKNDLRQQHLFAY
jgi:hypothetical protein